MNGTKAASIPRHIFCFLIAQLLSLAVREAGPAVRRCSVSPPPADPIMEISRLSPPGFQLSSDYVSCHPQTLWIKYSRIPELRRSSHCSASQTCTRGTISISPCLHPPQSQLQPLPLASISHLCHSSLPWHWWCLHFTIHLSAIQFYSKLSTTDCNGFLTDPSHLQLMGSFSPALITVNPPWLTIHFRKFNLLVLWWHFILNISVFWAEWPTFKLDRKRGGTKVLSCKKVSFDKPRELGDEARWAEDWEGLNTHNTP